MERAMNYNYRLLSKEQVFGETKIDVIRELGAECGVTDFAVLSGADASEERTAAWFLLPLPGMEMCAPSIRTQPESRVRQLPWQCAPGSGVRGPFRTALQNR